MRNSLHTSHAHRVVSNCRQDIEGFEKVYVSQVRLKKEKIEATLKECWLANCESFLESKCLMHRAAIQEFYSILSCDQLQNLLLVVSKLLKHCMFQYLFSQTLMTKSNDLMTFPCMSSSWKTSVLQGCNCILSEFQKYQIMQGMNVDLSKHEGS